MPYPERLLNEGEQISLDLQPHWWFFARQIGAAVPLLAVLALAIWQHDNDFGVITFRVWAVVTLLWAIWLAIKYLDWRFTEFVVTDQRVVFRTGVIAKRGVEIPLSRINNINFRQDVWERIIGAGDLEIESAGRDGQSVFDDVRHPDRVQQEIYRMMDANERRRAGWITGGTPAVAADASTARAPSVPEQLEQLASLRDRGVITPSEFEAKKAELLRRM